MLKLNKFYFKPPNKPLTEVPRGMQIFYGPDGPLNDFGNVRGIGQNLTYYLNCYNDDLQARPNPLDPENGGNLQMLSKIDLYFFFTELKNLKIVHFPLHLYTQSGL